MDLSYPVSAVTLTLAAVILTALAQLASAAPASLPPYTNHTVGGTAGWFFNAKKSAAAADYTKWAKSQSFNLGDFLIFNTDSNMSVIQTYNQTTYRQCDADADDAFVYAPPAGEKAAVIEVPLTAVGPNYFFSGAGDGNQCSKGAKFEIVVGKGRGLPAALNHPPPPPPVSDVQVPPPPDVPIGVTGGGSQEESFYTGGAGGGAGGWEIWGLGFLGAVSFWFL